ncbi:MAG: MCP four helix bundle domain-containing protein [Hydrogenophaga sp.]|uniref:methyl-accepting chemotaxis protein n=1 Tax=Hydrogenophaga sp. TaxID=1904254 RepID=UPI0025C39884|nr:methyl-accepting chemotaxis protein [Hydrogenophaga sp.]MBT9553262.1 MCP four helix bundle domain-containing protein [Hydrogenophaga sp.]
MNPGFTFGIARRLYAVSIAISVALAALGVYAYTSLHQAADLADFTGSTRVPQVSAMAEMELNVTQVSLQIRHAILARNPQEQQETLAYITDKRKHMDEVLAAYEKRLFTAEGKAHFATLPPLIAGFWKVGEANIALIQQGKKEEAFAYLVDVTIPARNQLLKAFHSGSEIQTQGLGSDIERIEQNALTTANLVSGLAVVILVVLMVFSTYVASVLRRRVAFTQAVAERVRDGDLTHSVADTARDEFTPLLVTMKDMQASLTRVVTEVRQGADGVATASAQIAQGNSDLSSRTEQQASALEETSASMEQMGSTASQNADNARQASQLATSASTVAVQGGEVVSQVVQTMKDINHSSQKISDIIGVIDGIAFQTNILALNAAVEAARAGEQGRGFAVVAAEVRNLAQRSAEAAKEIKGLINASVERVEQGTVLVDQAGSTMQEIVLSIQRVTDIVGEISSASNEQSAGVGQVSEAVSQMDQATQQNAALVEESAAAAGSLQQQAEQLVHAVSVFKLAGAGGPTARPAPAPAARVEPLPRVTPLKLAASPAARALRPAVVPRTPKAIAPPPLAVPTRSGGASDDWESF